jgi:hypothetical protein
MLKRNHHYVPRFWQRGFSDSSNFLYGRIDGKVRRVSPAKIMQKDYLYTVFDDQWVASDAVEDALAKTEGSIARLFKRLGNASSIVTPTDRTELCSALALQACRHPDILGRGYRLARELGALLAEAHNYSEQDFIVEMAKFGLGPTESSETYRMAIATPIEQLADELSELRALPQFDHRLPSQDALSAQSSISTQIEDMDIVILDAPGGSTYVLGDTPMPQHDLTNGFTVPISSSTAISAKARTTQQGTTSRRIATVSEVGSINQEQWARTLYVIIGPDPNTLTAL